MVLSLAAYSLYIPLRRSTYRLIMCQSPVGGLGMHGLEEWEGACTHGKANVGTNETPILMVKYLNVEV